MFFKICAFKNFTSLTGNHLCQSRFLINFKKRLQRRCFPVKIMKFLRIPCFTEHLRWLLLYPVALAQEDAFLGDTTWNGAVFFTLINRLTFKSHRSSHQWCSIKKLFLNISSISKYSQKEDIPEKQDGDLGMGPWGGM